METVIRGCRFTGTPDNKIYEVYFYSSGKVSINSRIIEVHLDMNKENTGELIEDLCTHLNGLSVDNYGAGKVINLIKLCCKPHMILPHHPPQPKSDDVGLIREDIGYFGERILSAIDGVRELHDAGRR